MFLRGPRRELINVSRWETRLSEELWDSRKCRDPTRWTQRIEGGVLWARSYAGSRVSGSILPCLV